MVSIEDKGTYRLKIKEVPKLAAFYNLLVNKTDLVARQDMSEADEIYFGIINAIQTNDKAEFETHYSKKKKSNPSKESPSPFVNDDFLIFCLIVGIVKFNSERKWIKNIISIRTRSPITMTFENILNEDYLSKSNLQEVVLIFFQLIKQESITNDFINATFKSISDNNNLFESRSDFQILCSIRAYDLIIELKESPEGSEIHLLAKFKNEFTKRIKFLAWLFQTIILISIFYIAFEIVSYKPEVKTLFDKIGSVLKVCGLFGLSQLGNIIPAIKRMSYENMLRLFGYPKELIKQHRNQQKANNNN